MMLIKFVRWSFWGVALSMLSFMASANEVKCGNVALTKYMTFSSADSCITSSVDPGQPDVAALIGLDHPDDYIGGMNANGNDLAGILNFSFDDPANSWDGKNNSGEWSFVDSNFWLTHSDVWIEFHVGGPSADGVNTFLFEVTPEVILGKWTYTNIMRPARGGFSAVHLWAKEFTPPTGAEDPPPPTDVPEPSALLLMMLGLIGLRFARR